MQPTNKAERVAHLHLAERAVLLLHDPQVVDDGEILRPQLLPVDVRGVIHIQVPVAVRRAVRRT